MAQTNSRKQRSKLAIFLEQFNSIVVWILIVAAIISAVVPFVQNPGEKISILDFVDAIVIIAILILNALFGFIQEYKAENSIQALKRMAGLKAKVLRDNKEIIIDVRELVPGDVVTLDTGAKVPADGRLTEAINLETQEASLTGESTPVTKVVGEVKDKTPIAEQHNMVFSSTIVTKGRGRALIASTGMGTQIGRIAKLISEAEVDETPLQKNLDKFGRQLGVVVIVIAVLLFAVGFFKHEAGILELLIAAVALAVAAIPEGLPAVVTISLALGVQRMVKRNALVRKLPSVETLGGTTVICSDKTGTLTHNQMTVKKVFVNNTLMDVSGEGYETRGEFSGKQEKELSLLLKIGALCNDAQWHSKEEVLGDPTEIALLVSAAKAGLGKEALEKAEPRIDEAQFDSARKRMSTVHKNGKKLYMYTKGSVEGLVNQCSRKLVKGKISKLTPGDRKAILKVDDELAGQALRVLGFAYREVKAGELKGRAKEKLETGLVFVGIQAMIDPPRAEVKDAVRQGREAGIRVIMVTGDHKLTAMAIAKDLGIEGDALAGEELDKANLDEVIDKIGIFARVSPEHKLRIVESLKKKGHIVAMTGDGVNDAPALKRADIGIAMGITGTDVAKEASEVILTDDNFASIRNAVEEGREIYENIKKFVYYLLSSNVAEVLIMFIAGILSPKLPLLAIHLLWINLVTDGLPALALGVDSMGHEVMKRPPRNPRQNILGKGMMFRILVRGIYITAAVLFLFFSNMEDITRARSIAFTGLVIFELFNAYAARTEFKFILHLNPFGNKWLLAAIGSSLLLQFAVIYTPLSTIFKTVVPTGMDWVIIGVMVLGMFVVDEIVKVIRLELIDRPVQTYK